MSAISLDLAKAHMKIDGSAEDELITLYIDGAEAWIANYIGKPVADFEPVPADLKIAILKLVAFNYEVRSLATYGLSVDMAPQGVHSILDNYRERWFGDGE
jgi:uncharacterized phage protein (predicted DNA packaging)